MGLDNSDINHNTGFFDQAYPEICSGGDVAISPETIPISYHKSQAKIADIKQKWKASKGYGSIFHRLDNYKSAEKKSS